MKYILISDYDDTLFINEKDMKNNVKELKRFRKNGNIFIISTARNYESIREEIDLYNIGVDYLFCNVGAVILDANGEVVYAKYLEEEQIKHLERIFAKYSDIEIIRCGDKKDYKEKINNIVEYKVMGEKSCLENICQEIAKVCPDLRLELIDNKKILVEVSTKEDAILKFCKIKNIPENEIVTVGDEIADLEMLRKYDGYRMEKSADEVIRCISKSVSSVADVIKKIMREDEK